MSGTRSVLGRSLVAIFIAVACGGQSENEDAKHGAHGTGESGGTSGSGAGGSGNRGVGGASSGVAGETGTAGEPGAAGDGGEPGGGGSAGSGGSSTTLCPRGETLDLGADFRRRPWVDAGAHHTCYLKRDGHLVCWGSAVFDILGVDWNLGAIPAPSAVYDRLSTGWLSCALTPRGEAECWGTQWLDDPPGFFSGAFKDIAPNYSVDCGLCADGTVACARSFEAPPAGRFVAITTGSRFGCVLADDGEVTCWPAQVMRAPRSTFVEISAGDAHACGIRPDGSVACWGDDVYGQASPPSGSFSHVSAGGDHSCALATDGHVVCWGVEIATHVPAGEYVQVSSGLHHSCALRADDKVACWGDGSRFQLDPPWEVAAEDETFTKIAVGGVASADPYDDFDLEYPTTACGLRPDGSIDCWGGAGDAPAGSFSELSVGARAGCALDAAGALSCWGLASPPVGVSSGTFTNVSVGYAISCAVRTSGELACWEHYGPSDAVSPGPPPSGSFVAVSASGDTDAPEQNGDYLLYPHACALRSDGDAQCWGYRGTVHDRSVRGPFVEVSAGSARDCALESNGQAVCWSPSATSALVPLEGSYAKLGRGNGTELLASDGTAILVDYLGTRNVAVADTFVDFEAANDFACGLRADGHVRCWGSRVR